MLISAKTFEELDFPALLELYREGNEENGACFYPHEPPQRQLELAEQDCRSYLQGSFFQLPNVCYWIWAEEGRYICGLRLEPYEDGLLLEALETRPGCRKQGYAKKLMTAVFARLPAGTRIYSHVSKRNTPSLAAHAACGFTRHLDYAVDSDGERNHGQTTLLYLV